MYRSALCHGVGGTSYPDVHARKHTARLEEHAFGMGPPIGHTHWHIPGLDESLSPVNLWETGGKCFKEACNTSYAQVNMMGKEAGRKGRTCTTWSAARLQ